MKRRVLFKTAPFHPLLKKSQNSGVLNGTMGRFLPLDAQRKGKKKFLSPTTPLSPFALTLT
jgi:hypothetical protein